ncbi:palmitoyltransferase SWF1, putative [Entamoeba invadens IP1]|uniref:Palmitoyltransferase n=1 Tax=Entamoeba invadens IP1 TaxID=370355 RepID=A0A0A1TY85_ENTIV|nr:palmitoyltransferase SWF1, putative [Entamoeba invadens IP1]ELP86450.1 palmitoyltransferase SWF1, putative [Entamoeba invadens IP1]|eukprot:XP_004185796.1 palmitoyltransferase SWF1, putative [Entamoeba invadens IP1]
MVLNKDQLLNEFYASVEKSLGKISYACVHILICILFSISTFYLIPIHVASTDKQTSQVTYLHTFNCLIFASVEYFLLKCKSTKKNIYTYRTYSFKRVGYCKICGKEKYPRVHHCSICNSCTLRMDHHCHFLNCCIGLHNLKFFFLFLLYAFAIVSIHFRLSILVLVSHQKVPNFSYVLPSISLLICLSCGISTFVLLAVQFLLISFNMTTIEFFAFLNKLKHDEFHFNHFNKSLIENWEDAFHVESFARLLLAFLPFFDL